MPQNKRYAQVGLGARSLMYTAAIVDRFSDSSQLVGLCDNNQGRLQARADWLRAQDLEPPPTYPAHRFDHMIADTQPDAVIVTTVDATHDRYICRAMELGCDVITEKPMTTDEAKCQSIIDTQKATGQACTVTFNYRYAPYRTQVKDLLMLGVIGNVVSVDFHWLLDTSHGADYFRRWHRNKRNSGGLLVHKATHHFDLVNWWLSTIPETVYATGTRSFYLPEMAERYGLSDRGQRCLTCPEQERCPFTLDLHRSNELIDLYLENEMHDGYFRDRCVFSPEIDIEDTLHLTVSYRNGASMSYSLHAFMPWEGYTIAFNGTKGRLQHVCQETAYISGDETVPGQVKPEGTSIKIFPHFQDAYEVELWQGEGGHGGADPVMLEALFAPKTAEDKYLRAADYRAGAWSILTGIAGNRSIEHGGPVHIRDLIRDLPLPDYTPTPDPRAPIDLDALNETAAPREKL